VISPESCAAIIWRDAAKADQAAAALRMTAEDLLRLELIDGIIPEPAGGAHENHDEAARLLKEHLIRAIDETAGMSRIQAVMQRYEKFRVMGNFFEVSPEAV
jgi:acetyl-CoA carboxylase carboxyl transferase subunit alpha